MQQDQSGTGRIAAVIGGFLVLLGMMLIGIFFLALFGIINPNLLIDEDFAKVFMLILVILGVLDFVSALTLSLR